MSPALIHAEASLFMVAMIDGTSLPRCLNSLAFLSFHISHITRSVMLRVALRGVAAVVVMLVHHSKVVELCAQFAGSRWGCAVQVAMRAQIHLVSRHSASMW